MTFRRLSESLSKNPHQFFLNPAEAGLKMSSGRYVAALVSERVHCL